MKFLIIFFVTVSISSINAFSANGASESQCNSMIPNYGNNAQPQKSNAPYEIILNKKKVREGDKVEITIRGKGSNNVIEGLLVQARSGDTPIGSFDVSSSRQYIQVLNCGNGRHNAVTHKDIANIDENIDQGINEVRFSWIAPRGLSEKVTFYATIAQNSEVFWVKVPSAEVAIAKQNKSIKFD